MEGERDKIETLLHGRLRATRGGKQLTLVRQLWGEMALGNVGVALISASRQIDTQSFMAYTIVFEFSSTPRSYRAARNQFHLVPLFISLLELYLRYALPNL